MGLIEEVSAYVYVSKDKGVEAYILFEQFLKPEETETALLRPMSPERRNGHDCNGVLYFIETEADLNP